MSVLKGRRSRVVLAGLSGLVVAGVTVATAQGAFAGAPAHQQTHQAAARAQRACLWPGAYLTAIRTSRHNTFDQVVFQFADAKPKVFTQTVPSVSEDPTGNPVPLAGQKYLLVQFRGASAVCIPTERRTYTGPKTLTPDYPELLTVSESGDFEMQLSFGIGLAGQAGYHWYRLASPDRIVLVVSHAALGRFPGIWGIRSWPQYWAAQYSWLTGHQPWLSDPAQVVAAYARARFRIEPTLHKVSQNSYWFTSQSGGRVTVSGSRPVRTPGPWVITNITGQ